MTVSMYSGYKKGIPFVYKRQGNEPTFFSDLIAEASSFIKRSGAREMSVYSVNDTKSVIALIRACQQNGCALTLLWDSPETGGYSSRPVLERENTQLIATA